MAFDSTKYKPKQGKFLPVLLLLDQSSSMDGAKIQALNQATQEMIDTFASVSNDDVELLVGIITFASTATLHTPFTPAKELKRTGWAPLCAQGNTAFGQALTLGSSLLNDSSTLPRNVYRPAVVTVSDGQPNDQWQTPLQTFLTTGRSGKCQRFAIGIGDDVDLHLLEQFTSDPQNLFQAEDAVALKQHFAFITQTVSQRSTSVSPNTLTPNHVTSVPTSLSPPSPPQAQKNTAPQTNSDDVDEIDAPDDFDDFDGFDGFDDFDPDAV